MNLGLLFYAALGWEVTKSS